jgi:hypothetical protein
VTKTIVAAVTLKTVCIHFAAKHVQIIAKYTARIAVENNLNLTESKRIICVKFATQTKEIRKEPSLPLPYRYCLLSVSHFYSTFSCITFYLSFFFFPLHLLYLLLLLSSSSSHYLPSNVLTLSCVLRVWSALCIMLSARFAVTYIWYNFVPL